MEWFMKALRSYADFKGRARRKEYWMFTLFFLIIYYGFIAIGIALRSSTISGIGVLIVLALFVPSLAVTVRRMHDVGKSGWFMFIPIYSLILACTEGDKGPNQYGEDPKNESITDGDVLDSDLLKG